MATVPPVTKSKLPSLTIPPPKTSCHFTLFSAKLDASIFALESIPFVKVSVDTLASKAVFTIPPVTNFLLLSSTAAPSPNLEVQSAASIFFALKSAFLSNSDLTILPVTKPLSFAPAIVPFPNSCVHLLRSIP